MNHDQVQQKADDTSERCASATRKSRSEYVTESIKAFTALDDRAKKSAGSFTYRYGQKPEDKVVWQILADDE